MLIGKKMDEHAKNIGDALSYVGVMATLAGWLPSVAALLSIIWTILRIWESATGQKFAAWLSELFGPKKL